MLMAARRRARRQHDGGQIRAGQHLSDAALPAAELPRLRLSRDQARAWSTWSRCSACCAVPPEVTDRPGATALAAHLSDGPAGEVRFEDVSFGYRPDRADPASGVDFTVPAGRQAGDRRADRRGQVHHQPAAVPLLRRDRRARSDRRAGHPRRDAGQPARGDRRGAAGHRAVQRHHPLQHRLWPARCVGQAEIEAGRAAGAGARFRHAAAGAATTRGWASAG